jgi:hypothetical protein
MRSYQNFHGVWCVAGCVAGIHGVVAVGTAVGCTSSGPSLHHVCFPLQHQHLHQLLLVCLNECLTAWITLSKATCTALLCLPLPAGLEARLPLGPPLSRCAYFCLSAKLLKLTLQLYCMCVQCVHGGISGAWVRLSQPHDLPNRQLAAGGLHVSCPWCSFSKIFRKPCCQASEGCYVHHQAYWHMC